MREARRVIVVIENQRYRNPFELWVLSALCFSSGLFLFGISPKTNSVAQVLPEWSTYLWAFMLFSGPATTIVGLFIRHPTVSRTIQIAGHLWTATGSLIYSCVLLYYIGAPALMTGITVGSIAVAALFRVKRLRRKIALIHQKLKEQDNVNDLDVVVNGGE